MISAQSVYYLKNAKGAVRRHRFGRALTRGAAKELGGGPKRTYHLGLRMLAMGDLNAVVAAHTSRPGRRAQTPQSQH